MADLQQQPTGHCCLQNVCWSLDTPCISGARENERITDGRLAVWREIQPGLSYYFAITKSIFYSLVPRLKVPWLVWCVIKRVSVQISAVALLSGGYGALVSSRHCLCQASLLWKGVVNSCTQLQIFCISTLENIRNFNTNPSSRKEKQFLFFINLAFWKTNMPATEMALLFDRIGQQQIVGRSFLEFFDSTLYSLLLSLLTPIFDFILWKQSLHAPTMLRFNLHAAN